MGKIPKNWCYVLYGAAILPFLLKSGIRGEQLRQQYFRVEPENTKAQEGSEVTLQCEIEHLKGKVQWTKDGFALGFIAEIPGYPRYRMVGDSSNGVYNLRIRNVSLEDDAEYQCQVGPYRPNNREAVSAIRSSANLTVLVPPASVEMVGRAANSEVPIPENQELTLECRARNSKPPARIAWYRGSSELKLENREDKVTELNENNYNPRTTLYDVFSRIRLTPTADDDDIKYSCEAQHDALPPDMALRTSVKLSVSYPPGDPFIEGYDPKRDIIRRGQLVELACRSRGGNPLAQLVWYRNGEEIQHTTNTYGRMAVNTLSFKADTKDNNARYTCKASSIVAPVAKMTETNLTVNYAPLHVLIFGTTQAKVGDTVQLNCSAGPSNPSAVIRWVVDGRHIYSNNSQVTAHPENGWTTSSTLAIPVTPERTSIVVICHGINALLNENVVATHTINILYPPGEPVISGYENEKYVESGTVQRLMCRSSGGNPLANLTWSKNDREIHSITKTDKTFVYSEMQILVNSTDNDAVYKCGAKNDAIDIPLFQSVKFKVYFPPDKAVIKKDPSEFRAGTIGRLICDASSSNPEANVTFWRDGIEIESISRKNKPGLHGGNVTSIVTVLNITADMHGDLFTCQAQNPKIGRSAHDELRLSVLFKPIFSEMNDTVFEGIEGENLIIPLQATGNPTTIAYTWSKNGVPLSRSSNYVFDGSTLNFTRLSRSDSGFYSCEALNKEGSSFMNFTVNVQYSAIVTAISQAVMVSDNEDAELWCTVDAFPLSAEHVTWRRPGFQFDTRAVQSFKNNTSFLTIREVTRKDMGQFYCVAENGLGNETSRAAYLVIKHKPEIDQSPVLLKAASRYNTTARLICRAAGAPKVMFIWSRDFNSLSVNTTPKYHTRYNQLDPITYESILSIHKVESSDYGTYQCKASNALGFSTTNVHFTPTSRPDPPSAMNVVNATHEAITITWVPGFDGGEPVRYRVRYRDASASSYSFRYSEADINTVYTISNLQLGTTYVFSVQAYNKLGESEYAKNMLKATTSSEAPPSLPSLSEVTSSSGRWSLMVGAVVALVIILSNILLLVFCVLRRSRKQIVAGMNEHSSNKSGTIEMYAPSSYNETVTGETLSSVSEKSETYSDTRSQDEKKRNGANAYMIEQIDYPFQYPGYDTHPKEHNSIGHHRNPYITHNGTAGYQSENSSRYSSTADPRYVTYPPPVQFAQPTIAPNGTLRRGAVPPPDVTVLTAPPPVSMSTFNYGNSETEGHLV